MGAPQEQPTRSVRELRPHLEPDTIVLIVDGPIARAGIASLVERARVLLERCDASQVVCDVSALADPDAVAVDALARLQLTARQIGKEVRFRYACDELQDLLSLMGLGEVMSVCPESLPGPRGQAEQREQPLGVEEEADPADPTL